MGSAATAVVHHPLVMVEVTPLIMTKSRDHDDGAPAHAHVDVGGDGDGNSSRLRTHPPSISIPSAKLQLLDKSRRGLFSTGWLGAGISENEINETNKRQARGLRLKVKLPRGQQCNFCQGKGSVQLDEARVDRVGDVKSPIHHNFNQTIVSGDLMFEGKDEVAGESNKHTMLSSSIFVTYLRSDDPLDERGVPCQLRGYIFAPTPIFPSKRRCNRQIPEYQCIMTTGTAVFMCPPLEISYNRGVYIRGSSSTKPNIFLHSVLSGTQNRTCVDTIPQYSKLSCYDKETVQSLSLRMSSMIANTVCIGTTPHALSRRNKSLQRIDSMKRELDAFWGSPHTGVDHKPTSRGGMSTKVPLLLREGALLVHNSHPNSGKSTLVEAIAISVLECNSVHIISAPALIAKYGTSADAALESILHELALRCAVTGGGTMAMNHVGYNEQQQNQVEGLPKLCIILDHLESFLPSSSQSTGDPYLPVLNGMIAHLNRLSISLKTRNEFPFPSNNPLCNVCASDRASVGFTLPLGICLVGVMTCIEGSGKRSSFQSALDAVGGGRFRVPLPSAMTRLSAFIHAFEICGVMLTKDAKTALPELCATMNWASGGAFLIIARKLKSDIRRTGPLRAATETDLKRAMMRGLNQSISQTVSTTNEYPSLNAASGKSNPVTFSSVGGNVEAKLALEDALALDPAKQRVLSKFGLKLPTGVLLYGPPGTGKTLLARAVAQLLCRKDNMGVGNNGGAFVSLKASDIVRPEVGGSEKMIVSAFETARQNAPSVLFIDEFQALFGDREGGGFILGQLSSTLLQCMDDIMRWSEADPPVGDESTLTTQNRRVVVLGATNAPWMIDKAFLRPGRFDRAVHVGLPNVKDSEDILRVHVSKMKLAPLTDGLSPVDEICKSMAQVCLGYSGADLAALCRAAAVRCLSNGDGAIGITKQHFSDAALHDVMRSSSDQLLKKISAWKP